MNRKTARVPTRGNYLTTAKLCETFLCKDIRLRSLSSRRKGERKKKILHDTRVDACRALRDPSENDERVE